MSELTQIEREAKAVRDFITELKGLTPKFNATKERAEEELKLHLAKIDAERAKLRELIDGATVIVQRLGLDEPVETTHTEAETAAVMAEDQAEQEPEIAGYLLAGGAQVDVIDVYVPADFAGAELVDVSTGQEVSIADAIKIAEAERLVRVEAEPAPETFQSIGEIAAEVTAAVAAIASEPPATEDASEADEMTDEQVERLEEQTAQALAEEARSETPEQELAVRGSFLNRVFA